MISDEKFVDFLQLDFPKIYPREAEPGAEAKSGALR